MSYYNNKGSKNMNDIYIYSNTAKEFIADFLCFQTESFNLKILTQTQKLGVNL